MARVRLGEVFQISSGGTPSKQKTEYYLGGSIPWVKTGDLKDKFVSEDIERITKDGLDNSSAKLFPKNTVLIAMYGATIGACSILPFEASTNQACAAFLPNDAFNPEFLFYFLSSQRNQFIKDGVGGAQPNISAGYLKNVFIPLISIDQQSEIVRSLNRVDTLISLRKQQLAKLDELIKAHFVEMFGDPVENDKGWDAIRLENACDGVGDGLHGTPEYDEDGKYPFINGNNLIDGTIKITSATKHVNEATYKEHFIDLSRNAILISINGTLGKLAYYKGEKVMLGKSACYCNLKPFIQREFVFAIMKTDAFLSFLERNATASTIKNVGLKAIRGYKLIMPPNELQNQFIEFAKQIDKSKAVVQQSLDKLETLKKALMQQYFG